MFPICSPDVSISRLKLFCSWQFIRFSSPSQGWVIIKPHQAWKGNHSWAFFSHGVFPQWQAQWLCSLWVRLSPVLRRHTCVQIETGGDRWRVQRIGLVRLKQPSGVTHQHTTISMYHAERYTWGLSHSLPSSTAPGLTDGLFSDSRRRPVYHSPVKPTTVTVYCPTVLVNHVENKEICSKAQG